jgi:hypothetical protein
MRQRANRATWIERIRSWKSSGKSAEEFAAGQPYKPKTLTWWANELKQEVRARRIEMARVEVRAALPSTIVIEVGGARSWSSAGSTGRYSQSSRAHWLLQHQSWSRRRPSETSCDAHTIACAKSSSRTGSPRAWRRRNQWLRSERFKRFPHVRGDDACALRPHENGRFTPTCVETTLSPKTARIAIAVHPHVRGDDGAIRMLHNVYIGSPHRAFVSRASTSSVFASGSTYHKC